MFLLKIEVRELQKQYEKAFGSKLGALSVCRNQTVPFKDPEFKAFGREIMLEALRKGKPYQADPTRESKAWEMALIDKLVQTGKWPPRVSNYDGLVWDRKKILDRLKREIREDT